LLLNRNRQSALAFARRTRQISGMAANTSIRPEPSLAAGRSETRPASSMSRRQILLLAAAVVGGLAGGLFSSQIVETTASLWSNYVVPAYFELMLSGIPLCA